MSLVVLSHTSGGHTEGGFKVYSPIHAVYKQRGLISVLLCSKLQFKSNHSLTEHNNLNCDTHGDVGKQTIAV